MSPLSKSIVDIHNNYTIGAYNKANENVAHSVAPEKKETIAITSGTRKTPSTPKGKLLILGTE